MRCTPSLARRIAALLVVPLGVLSADAANAQALADSISDTVTPNSQTAAVDDAWAFQTNPAGLAFVESFQVVGGYTGRLNQQLASRHNFLVQGAVSPYDGIVLGSGGGYLHTSDGRMPTLRNTMALALRLDRTFAIGGQVHSLLSLDPAGPTPRFLGDIGTQLRPLRWFALGFALEGIGAALPGDTTNARIGMSVRPFTDRVTVGADMRLVSGSADFLTQDYYLGAQLEPALAARVRILGVVGTAGVTLTNLGVNTYTQPGIRVGVGLEVNTAHIGAMLLGGGSGSTIGNAAGEAGALFRVSGEEFESVIPRWSEWLSFTLVGNAVPEQRADNLFEELFNTPTHPVTVLAGLERAANDSAIEGVVLRIRGLSIGWGRATELRSAIDHLRANGKKVVVHLDGGGDSEVYLASAADKIYLSPAGSLALDGLHVQLTYVASALQRFGIKAQAVAAGEYKSAPRTFTADEPNDEELEVQEALLDTLFRVLVEGVAEGRDIPVDKVKELIDMGGLSADEARRFGIVDDLGYFSELPKMVQADLGGSKPYLRTDYLEDNRRTVAWADPPRIAIIPVVGSISMGRGGGGLFDLFGGGGAGADDIIDAIEAARKDDDVEAVVLRVDSPGGDALASDLIWHALMRLREEKPVVASMGDVAASGGYYVAAAAKEIYAEPDTITGSIGVFSLFFQAEQLANDLGVSTYNLNRGAKPGPDLLREPSEEELARMKEHVDWVYERFLTVVKTSRGMDDAHLRKIANGRVWTGEAALENGLVDKMGGIQDAIARARELGGLDTDEEVELVILTGSDELLPRINTAARAMVGVNAEQEQLQRAMRLLLGDHAELALMGLERKTLAADPRIITIE